MSNEIKTMTDIVTVTDGKATTTSIKIAEVFGKDHAKVIRTIRELKCSPEFSQANFGLAEYVDEQGKPRPMYTVTRDGFTILAMGFTGEKAMQFKEAYIAAFNAMENALKSASPSQDVLMATLYAEMERRIKAEAEAENYRTQLRRIAIASNLEFGAISRATGLPKDIVIGAHCKSSSRPHHPQYPRYIQLVLPLREIVEEARRNLESNMQIGGAQ